MFSDINSCTPEFFEFIGANLYNVHLTESTSVSKRRFRACFGVNPKICAILWDLIRPEVPRTTHPNHLLWGLMFLKVYGTEPIHASIVGANEKTFRKWQWLIITALSNIKAVCYFFLLLLNNSKL